MLTSAPMAQAPDAAPPEAPRGDEPSRRRRGLGLALVALAALAAAAGGLQLVWHYRIFFGRATYPLDLEWMEGGILLHAYRYAHGQNIYVPPSVDFIPFFYTPLYQLVVAGLSKLFGLGYLLGRTVSIVSFTGALALLVRAATRTVGADGLAPSGGGQGPGTSSAASSGTSSGASSALATAAALAVGIAAAGGVAGGYVLSGSFYDLARSDSLLLFLQAAALYAASERESKRSAALAGVLIALAFFTKQVASITGLAIGVGLLVTRWRRGVVYGFVAAAVLGAGLFLLNRTSSGWFWKYVFQGHQSHGFNTQLAWHITPQRLWQHGWPAVVALGLALFGLALGRRFARGHVIVVLTAVAGVLSGCIGMGTQWAFENAYMPSVFFPLYALAVLGAAQVSHAVVSARPGAVAAAVLVSFGLGGHALHVPRPDYDKWTPGPGDRAAAERFLTRLRALPGELFIPFHPFYGVLAGKQPYLHRMGILDVATMVGRPARLDEAIDAQRFAHIVLDYKYQEHELPGLPGRYHTVHTFKEGQDTARVFSGADTSPSRLLVPTQPPPPLPPGARRIADFETPDWSPWVVEGTAFGLAPAPATGGLFGAKAADSGAAGLAVTGVARSQPFVVDRPHLRFTLRGTPAVAGLRVALLEGAGELRSVTPQGSAPTLVDWDLADVQGRQVQLLIEDASGMGALAVDEVVLY